MFLLRRAATVVASVARFVARSVARRALFRQGRRRRRKDRTLPAASIDRMPFFDGASTGGAFRLSGAAAESATELIRDWRIEVRAGSEIVVARGEGGARYEEARDDALAAANRGLDFMCLRGATPLAIRHSEIEHIVWWSEDSRSVVRLLSIPTINVDFSATGTGGTPVVPPPPEWQESARYFRLSQLTDDLFDSFRNVYLALESILDHLAPQRPGEREGDWFHRALTEAGTIVTLAGHAPKGAADPVQALFDELYLSTRNLVFHAKATRAYLLPQSSPKRRAVEETTRRAAYLYLALAEQIIHLRPPSSGITPVFWRMQIDGLAPQLGIVVTNDPAPFSSDETEINPSGGELVELSVSRAPDYDQPFQHAFLGVGKGSEIAKLGQVTRVCSTVDGELSSVGFLEGALRVSHVERFEALVVLRARNVKQPKRDFAS
jgi:hypothetical protein